MLNDLNNYIVNIHEGKGISYIDMIKYISQKYQIKIIGKSVINDMLREINITYKRSKIIFHQRNVNRIIKDRFNKCKYIATFI